MHVIAVHDISDPDEFTARSQAAMSKIPPGMTLQCMLPSTDGRQTVCVWEAASPDAVQSFLDSEAGDVAHNACFAVAEEKAIGLKQLTGTAA
jgi:hypothetical protein